MCPLGMYGQESKWVDMNPVRKRYLRFHKDFAVDSVKYPIWEYQNSVIFANSGVTLQFKKGGPFFTQTKVLYIKGNIIVGGNSPIVEWSRLRHGTPNEFNWYWCF